MFRFSACKTPPLAVHEHHPSNIYINLYHLYLVKVGAVCCEENEFVIKIIMYTVKMNYSQCLHAYPIIYLASKL